jgi:hypothetical protein
MPWIEQPDRGWIAGTVAAATAGGHDGIEVSITRRRFWPFGNTTRVRTDGNGYFGLAKLKPGRYEVSIESPGALRWEVSVERGRVSRVDFWPSGSAPRQR